MITTSVWMTKPYQVELIDEELDPPAADEVVVRTVVSGISSGTELLFYRGEFPRDIPMDQSIAVLSGPSKYPFRYGYCNVGEVVACGSQVDDDWLGQKVFAFQPHTRFYTASVHEVLRVPSDINQYDAVFLPNMETAVNFLMDGAPIIGESVVVLGQGIVGLLTTGLLSMFPLSKLISLDKYQLRREFSTQVGAAASIDPSELKNVNTLKTALSRGADLIYEISGSPEAINLAIELVGFEGRIVIGSWYGQKRAALDLGGKFHRSRIKIISSQVSTIASESKGRWDKNRRYDVAWVMIRKFKPGRLITHKFLFRDADKAYKLLDQDPQNTLQVVFEYD